MNLLATNPVEETYASWRPLALLLTLLLGLLIPAHADRSLITPHPGNQQSTDRDRQTAPVEQPIVLAYKYDDPARSGTNWYAYCGGDPVNRSDSSGLDWVWNVDADCWKWDNTWDGKSGVELADVPWTVRDPISSRGNPGDRLGIDFYRQAGLLDQAARFPQLDSFTGKGDDPAWVKAGDRFLLIGSKAEVALAAAPVAPLLGLSTGGLLAIEGAGGGFGAADAMLDSNVHSFADVADRTAGGAAFAGVGTVSMLTVGRIPGVGQQAQAALASLFVGAGAYGTYESMEEGNGAQAALRGTGTLLGASGLAGQFNPRLGFFNYELNSVGAGSNGGNLQIRYVGPSSLAVGPYRDVGGHHLSQNAAFRDVIPRAEGLATPLAGNAFAEPGSPHYNFHASLESFWRAYRFGGASFGSRPSIGDYNTAVYAGLIRAGLSSGDANALMAEVVVQQAKYGLSTDSLVPRIPGPINQTPP